MVWCELKDCLVSNHYLFDIFTSKKKKLIEISLQPEKLISLKTIFVSSIDQIENQSFRQKIYYKCMLKVLYRSLL
jgi:hypothetical protein